MGTEGCLGSKLDSEMLEDCLGSNLDSEMLDSDIVR